MRIIKIIPSKKFRGHWVTSEAEGVEPAFPSKEQAISYARDCRFGGVPQGEIHIYDEAGEAVVEVIKVAGRKY